VLETGTLLLFWAKKGETPEVRYPLLCHMLDVASVTQEMWRETFHPELKQFLSGQLGLSENDAGLLLSFWAGLHDLGKASPGFQSKSPEAKEALEAEGFTFYGYDSSLSHGIVTASALTGILKSAQYSTLLATPLAIAIGGHHGIFPRSDQMKPADQLDSINWRKARNELFEALARVLGVDLNFSPQGKPKPSFFMLFAGLVSVADWVGSNQNFFPIGPLTNLGPSLELSGEKAIRALEHLGWIGWHPVKERAGFKQLFPFIEEERPLQKEAINLASSLGGSPGLVVIEAPTGEGKTEAAMYLADHWISALGQKGAYFALPTQATSDQMFGRVSRFIKTRYPLQVVNLQLLHGHASLSAEFEMLKQNFADFLALSAIGEDEKAYDEAPESVVAGEWFTYRKRGLLAPFGVGTIDQALLAALQTRHVFVRLFGLASKTVIFDEVHAYDVYMTTILERLLEWLGAIGSSVILLSATLPRQRRNSLMQAYERGFKQEEGTPKQQERLGARYPRISWVVNDGWGAKEFDASPQAARVLNLEWVDGELGEGVHGFYLGERLQLALSSGGCAAIICNTVSRAQCLYQALKPYFPDAANDDYPELDLLHARFLFGERERREKQVLLRFGKKGDMVRLDNSTELAVKRPYRAVLVATQVIEQSLDLDFDLMVTDMAPVDLILQRAGRLQRHQQKRPPNFEGKPATLWICEPWVKETGSLDFGAGTEAVYDRHVLLRSYLALNRHNSIRIPEDVEPLIEAVYGDEDWSGKLPDELKQDWQESLAKHRGQLESDKNEAAERWIKSPNFNGALWRMTYEPREEDDPSLHPAYQALTCLGGLDIQAICLYSKGERLYLDDSFNEPVDSQALPDMEVVKKLLRRSVRLSRRGLGFQLAQEGIPIPKPWRESPLLRHHYLLLFDENDRYKLGNYELRLDDELGVIIDYNSPQGGGSD